MRLAGCVGRRPSTSRREERTLFFDSTADAATVHAQRLAHVEGPIGRAGERGSQIGNLLRRAAVGSTSAKSFASLRICRHRTTSAPRSTPQTWSALYLEGIAIPSLRLLVGRLGSGAAKRKSKGKPSENPQDGRCGRAKKGGA